MIRFRPPRIAMAFACAAAVLHWLLSDRLPFRLSSPAGGFALGIIGVSVMLRGWWLFKNARVAISPTAETTQFVSHGIYRVTRNPMYLGLVLMMVGLAVSVGSVPLYAAALAYFAVINWVFCRYEEAKLAARFGNEYAEYSRRVRRWL
jgi:protein-S-isoprenylcysteine O-methyltransferase Ste14